MKNFIYALSLLWMILILGCGEQNKSGDKAKETVIIQKQSSLDTLKVEQTVDEIYTAMIERDAEMLTALCSEDLSYGHSSGLIQDKETFIDDVVNGPFTYISISPEDQSIKIVGQTAFVRHVFVSEAMNAGEHVNIRIGCLQAYQYNSSGDLQLIIRQAYKL